MKWLFLSKAKDDPATRYRAAPVVQELRDRGDEVECSYEPGTLAQIVILIKATHFDGVFIQRKLFSGWFLKLLGMRARRVFFDFDDAVFLKSSGLPSKTRAAKFTSTMKISDLVFAGNSYLLEAATLARRTRLTPTCVDVPKYSGKTETLPEIDLPGDGINLVWIGSRSTAKYLQQQLPALEAIGQAFPDVTLNIIANFSLPTRHLKVNAIDWSAETEVALLKAADIGIAPMIDDPWTRGKCALKVIQYMAAGLPVVSSAVGANEDVVVQGETGLLVGSIDQWVDAIGQLAQSAELREKMGQCAMARAAAHYDLTTVARRVADDMTQACRS